MLTWLAVLLVTLVGPPASAASAELDGLSAEGAVIYDPLDDRVLWGRDELAARPMASLTKMMTALLAVEAGTLDDTVTVSERAEAVGRSPGAATLGLRAGERLAMTELLIGLMLRSGNDAAVAVAEHVSGTEQDFVVVMNERASELGLDDTSFTDASGLTDDPAHHSSPADLARLGAVVLTHDFLAEAVAQPTAPTSAFGTIANRNRLVGSYAGADGVKTGYTAVAGQCLVASATRDGRPVITVVLDSQDNTGDSRALLDHAFSDWRRVTLDGDGLAVRTSGGVADVSVSRPVAATVAVSDEAVRRVIWDGGGGSGVADGRVGTLELLVDDDVVASAPLTADVPEAEPGTPAAIQDALRAVARAAASRAQQRPS